MTKRKRPTSRRRQATRTPKYVMRVNILLTQEQFVKLSDRAREEGRPLPNFLRRLFDLALAQPK